MSNLTTCLNGIISTQKTTPTAFARETGIEVSLFSRIIKGERDASHEVVKALLKKATSRPDEAREILRAHLLDEIERLDAAALATLHLGDAKETPEESRRTDQLLRIIANVKEAAELAKMIVELAENSHGLARNAAYGIAEPIPYSKNEDTHPGLVAEDPPAKPPKKPVSKK